MSELKNNLLLRALKNEKVERPPVWMMRQAGRYLPNYIKLRNKYDFFTRVQTPELATEITLQPIDQVGGAGYFQNRTQTSPSQLIEYNFEKSPTLNVTGIENCASPVSFVVAVVCSPASGICIVTF